MDKGDDPIAAFGSAEEGDEPLLPYIDVQAFEQVDRGTKQLAAIFDAITLAGVDYYLEVQQTPTKQYTLTKNDKAVTEVMDNNFKDNILEALDEHQNN